MQNPWGKPVVGWLPTAGPDGIGSLHNPMGFACLRVMNVKNAEDGSSQALYDQTLIIENPGAIVIATTEDRRIGLVQNFRMNGERFFSAGSDYVRQLHADNRWSELLETLGGWSWEAPRGLTTDPYEEDLERFVLKTAKAEALEEGGFIIGNTRIVGQVNANTTFFAHPQWVVHATIIAKEKAQPEDLEMIGKAKLFTVEELRKLAKDGKFTDGLTLAGMALCGISL
ncbi:MAG: hypothetical protein NUV81_04040 [bacterium]|nr:hypothetical protein [bacterium]